VEVRFGPFCLHPIEGLRRGSRELHVTPKSLAVLHFLASHPGRVIPKDDLVRAVWQDVAVSDSALTSCIKELRRTLKDDAKRPRFIETLNRRGYRFVADVAPATFTRQSGLPSGSSGGFLVGREETLARMSAALARAAHGERQILFLAGEPGIGKTAVVETFSRGLEQDARWRVTRGVCVERYGAAEPYQPLLDAITRLCRGADTDRFLPILRQCAPSWLAQLPALQTPAEHRLLSRRAAGVTPERMQRELVDALESMAGETPILLWLEDVHWSDIATVDWLTALAVRTDHARLLLIATCRTGDGPSGRHPLPAIIDTLRGKGLCEEIVLARLLREDVRAYIAARFSTTPETLDRLAALVHRHTEGNPLFVVNLLGDLVARGVLAREENLDWSLAATVDEAALGVPEDVRRAIARQLERVNPADRALLETMSIVGQRGAAAAIAAGADAATVDTESALGALARDRCFVRECPRIEWPDGTVSAGFEFLHALYREVLDARVHAARRVELHRRIGERLEQGYGVRAGEIAAELAGHFEGAREISRALVHLLRAAETSRGRSAYPIAEQQLRRALVLVEQLPMSTERRDREIDIRIALGTLLMATRGWASDEIETHYRRALHLCPELDSSRSFPSLWGLWLFHWGRGDGTRARDLAATLRNHAATSRDRAHILQASHANWATSFSQGRLDEALRFAREGRTLYQIEPDAALAPAYGSHDPLTCAMNFAARALSLMGAVDDAVSVSEESIAFARELGHPFTLALALFFASTVRHARQEPEATLARASEGAALARAHGFRLTVAWASILEGCAIVQIGGRDDGLESLRGALSTADAGQSQFMTYFHGIFAEACLACNRGDEGLRSVETGLRLAEEGDERFYEAELYRLRGELRLARSGDGAAADAEQDFRRAIAIAEAQGAQRLELRAATSLARLGGMPDEERRHLLMRPMQAISQGMTLDDARTAREMLQRVDK
jgi:DNA-binding winged helix-turn-helix (wHTH) protein